MAAAQEEEEEAAKKKPIPIGFASRKFPKCRYSRVQGKSSLWKDPAPKNKRRGDNT